MTLYNETTQSNMICDLCQGRFINNRNSTAVNFTLRGDIDCIVPAKANYLLYILPEYKSGEDKF